MHKNTKAFIILCMAYIISQFHRSSLAVISTDLSREFSLSISELGFVTAAFFLAFMVFQIPAGMMLDRMGAKKTLIWLLVLNALGSLVFALAQGFISLSTARILLGVGNSALLIGTLIIVAALFPPEQFSRYSGYLLAIGTLGNLLSTFPMGYAQDHFGWRSVFFAFTLIPLIFAWLIIKNIDELPLSGKKETFLENIRGFRFVFGVKDFWKLFFVQLVWYAGTMSLFALWGRPLLKDVYGLDNVQSGYVLMLFPILSIFSYLAFGRLDVIFNTRKWLIVIGVASNGFCFLLLALFPAMPLWLFAICVGVIGLAAGGFPFLLAHGRASFPAPILGRGIATLNLANMGGVGFMQMITSGMFDNLKLKGFESTEIYPILFGIIAACLFSSILFYLFADDKKPLKA